MFLLDTNVLSELARARPDLAVSRRIHATDKDLLFASEMTRYELRYGAALHPRSEEIWDKVQRQILPLPVWIPIDHAVAKATGDLDAALRKRGLRIDLADAFIAATALAYDLVLVTRNVRHFENVPELATENWFAAT